MDVIATCSYSFALLPSLLMNIITKKGGIFMHCSGYDNSYGYGHGRNNNFALLVVLFILLIIIGASFMHRSC